MLWSHCFSVREPPSHLSVLQPHPESDPHACNPQQPPLPLSHTHALVCLPSLSRTHTHSYAYHGTATAEGVNVEGSDSGYCDDPSQFHEVMPFCGEYVTYRACLPNTHPNWPNHTVATKDRWIDQVRFRIVGPQLSLRAVSVCTAAHTETVEMFGCVGCCFVVIHRGC